MTPEYFKRIDELILDVVRNLGPSDAADIFEQVMSIKDFEPNPEDIQAAIWRLANEGKLFHRKDCLFEISEQKEKEMINVNITIRNHQEGDYFFMQNVEIEDVDAFLYSLWDRLNDKVTDFILINQSLFHKPSIKYIEVVEIK